MSAPTEKHREEAEQIVAEWELRSNTPTVAFDEFTNAIARVLAAAEKRGLERAAEIARTVETPEEGEYWISNRIEHAILEEINQSAAASSHAPATNHDEASK